MEHTAPPRPAPHADIAKMRHNKHAFTGKYDARPDLREVYTPDIVWGYLQGYRGGSVWPILWKYWHRPRWWLKATLRAWLAGAKDRQHSKRGRPAGR